MSRTFSEASRHHGITLRGQIQMDRAQFQCMNRAWNWLMKVMNRQHFFRRTTATLLPALYCPGLALAGTAIIHNDVLWSDTAGKEVCCNGGHIIREGDVS